MGIFRVPVTITHPSLPGPAMNVFHVRTIGPSGDDADQLGDALDALEEFYNGFGGFMPAGTQVTLGEGMIKDPLGNPEYQDDDSRILNFNTGPAGPTSVLLAVVVSWRTSSASRSGRGRTFTGPFQTGLADPDGTPNAALLNAVRASGVGLVNSSGGPGGWAVGILSVKQGLLRDITGSTVRDRWSFLSSRRD